MLEPTLRRFGMLHLAGYKRSLEEMDVRIDFPISIKVGGNAITKQASIVPATCPLVRLSVKFRSGSPGRLRPFAIAPIASEIANVPITANTPTLPSLPLPHEYTVSESARMIKIGAPKTSCASRLVPSISAVSSIQVKPRYAIAPNHGDALEIRF